MAILLGALVVFILVALVNLLHNVIKIFGMTRMRIALMKVTHNMARSKGLLTRGLLHITFKKRSIKDKISHVFCLPHPGQPSHNPRAPAAARHEFNR